MSTQKPLTLAEVFDIINAFRKEEARRRNRIDSQSAVRTLRLDDPDFLKEFEPLRTIRVNGRVGRKLGLDMYQVEHVLVRVKDGRYYPTVQYEGHA